MLKKPIINTGVQIGGKGILIVFSLVTTALLTRILGEKGYGYFVLINSVFILLDSLADFGTKIIGVKEISGKKRAEAGEVFCQIGWLRLIMAAGAFVVGLGVVRWWPGLSEVRTAALVGLFMLWLTSIAGSLEIVFQSQIKMGWKVAMDIIMAGLVVIGVAVGGKSWGLVGVMIWYLVARVISLVPGAIKLGKERWLKWKIRTNRGEINRLWQTIWPMGLYLIIFASYDRAVDSIMIQKLVSIEAVAVYGLAYKIYGSLIQPAYYFSNSIFPLLVKNDGENVFSRSWKLALVGAAVMALGAIVGAPLMVKVLAPVGFEEAVGIIRILAVGLIFAYVNHIIGFSLISQERQKTLMLMGGMTLVFNIGANWLIIPYLGIKGAAAVTVLTEAVMLIVGWVQVRRPVLIHS